MLERLEPSADALWAERQVLGAALVAPVAGDLTLTTADFYTPAHAAVWEAVRALTDRGEPVEPGSVWRVLADTDGRRAVGSPSFLADLVGGLATTANVAYHAGIVAEAARLRRLWEAGVAISQLAANPGTMPLDDRLAIARERIEQVEDGQVSSTAVDVADLLTDAFDRYESSGPVGYRTGIADLDEVLLPMAAGQVIVIGARTGVGKSTLALQVARNIAEQDGRVLFCALEMGRDEVMDRLLAQVGVPLTDLRARSLDERQWARVVGATDTVTSLPIRVEDNPNLTLPALRALCRREARTGLALVVVDYLQLMTAPKAENRQGEVAALSRGLKLLAKEVGVTVLMVCQVNRAPEARGDRRPRLSDLRESGAIEQDADAVLLLHDDEERPGEMDVIVAKQRNGPHGMTIPVGFQGAYSRVVDLARRWQAA